MRSQTLVVFLVAAVVAISAPVASSAARTQPGAPHLAAAAPVHAVSVAGTGVGMYPGFSRNVSRYAVTTTSGTAGTVEVTATTSDASGRVWVNGRAARTSTTTVTGLSDGDEISVFVQDSAGLGPLLRWSISQRASRASIATKAGGHRAGLGRDVAVPVERADAELRGRCRCQRRSRVCPLHRRTPPST